MQAAIATKVANLHRIISVSIDIIINVLKQDVALINQLINRLFLQHIGLRNHVIDTHKDDITSISNHD